MILWDMFEVWYTSKLYSRTPPKYLSKKVS